MSKRLTEHMRSSIIRAILSDVPQENYTEQIRKAVYDYAVEALPPNVREIYKNQHTRKYLRTMYVHDWGISVAIPTDDEFKFKTNIPPLLREKLTALQRDSQEQNRKMRELERKLEPIVKGATTLKRLKELLPEFAKYMPEEHETDRQLPVIANVVSAFIEAGWPKDQKKPATK